MRKREKGSKCACDRERERESERVSEYARAKVDKIAKMVSVGTSE